MIETKKKPDFLSMEEFNRSYAYKVIVVLLSLVLIVMYIEGMLTPSLPTIQNEFKITAAQTSLILSMYAVSGVAATPIIGKLGDIYGKKKLLVITMLIYSLAVTITGFSPTFEFMVVFRTIQGVGLAVLPLGLSLVREEFPKELVPKAQAIISAMFGVGFAISIPLGSLVSNNFGWRWTYHSAIPIVIGLVIITLKVLKESRYRRPSAKIDYVGAILLAFSLSMYVFALSEATTYGWFSFYIFLLLLLGTATLIPLIWYEIRYTHKGKEAILNFNLLSTRNILVANIVLTIVGISMFLSLQALTYRFIFGFNKSILETGLSIVPFALGVFVFGPITAAIVSKTGVKLLSIIGAIITAFGFLMQATLPSYGGMLIFEFITGGGISLLNGTLINFVVLTAKPKDLGLAVAMNSTFRNLGSSIGASVAGSILATYVTMITINTPSGPQSYSIPSDFAFIFLFILAAILFFSVLFMILFGKEVIEKKKR